MGPERTSPAFPVATGVLGIAAFGVGALAVLDRDLAVGAMVLGLALFAAAVAWGATDANR